MRPLSRPLCYRCVRHAGKRLHWCIRLAFDRGEPVACSCPCRGRP